ncbi:MAG: VWA domain-containing protein [Ignavibacteria bacterium]|nr:VWA domain-containing protein [Ignavibacteria bacterium]
MTITTQASSHTARNRARSVLVAALFALLCAPYASNGQFRLFLQQPETGAFPRIRIPLKVINNSASIGTLAPSNFTLTDNGVPRAPLEIDCATNDTTKQVNVMFILDVSLSMSFVEGTRDYDPDSLKWKKAKQMMSYAFHRLRATDKGGLVTFGEEVQLEHTLTSNLTLLDDAVAGLGLRPGTAIYDAVLFTLPYCTADTGSSKTIVILLTDGSDQSSMNTLIDAIDDARRRRIPLYTIGLGVEPGDETALDSLSRLTGGECLLAPTSERLQETFDRIFKSIYASNCILSYTTPDTCRQGEEHRLEITVNIDGKTDFGTVRYTDPDYRSQLAVRALLPDTLTDDQTIVVPVVAEGEIRADEALHFALRFGYDSSAVRFIGLEGPTTLLDPATITAGGTAGSMLITPAWTGAAVPRRGMTYGAGDTLFFLRLHVPFRSANLRTALTLAMEGEGWRQHCDVLATSGDEPFVISGCPELLRFGIDSGIVARPLAELVIPVWLHDSIDIAQQMELSFFFRYDENLLHFNRYETGGTVSAGTLLTVVEMSPGLLFVSCSKSDPAGRSGVLLRLVFTAGNRIASSRVSISVEQLFFAQSCAPRLEFAGDHVTIDGWCERLLTRKPVLQVKSIYPNPVLGAHSATATVEFAVHGTGRSRIELTDLQGEVLRMLFDGYFAEGTHAVSFSIEDLPSGSYLCTLSEGYAVSTKRLIISR